MIEAIEIYVKLIEQTYTLNQSRLYASEAIHRDHQNFLNDPNDLNELSDLNHIKQRPE
jgi:hypothetical protein